MKTKIDPSIRQASTFTAWPQMPKAHGPFGKDTLNQRERKSMTGIPLFLNVQTRRAIKEAHALGGKALSYLSFYDTYVHTAGFENGTARVPWDPQKASILLIDWQGRFVNTPMDGCHRMWRYLVCNNTKEFVEMALDMVRQQMERGADGIFIDNSNRRFACYGHGVPVGYSNKYRGVTAYMPEWEDPSLVKKKSPEELYCAGVRPSFFHGNPDRKTLPVHRHIYPNKSHVYAYERLLEKVRKVVREYGSDKVVIVNGEGRSKYADGFMLESYIYSWTWKGPRRTWRELKVLAEQWAPYLRKGKMILALDYLGNTNRNVVEDALFACSSALLSGFMWSDYNTGNKENLCRALQRLDLGRRLSNLCTSGTVDYSFFEKGLVAINGGAHKSAAYIPVPSRFRKTKLHNMIDNKEPDCSKGILRLAIPAHSGSIYQRGC